MPHSHQVLHIDVKPTHTRARTQFHEFMSLQMLGSLYHHHHRRYTNMLTCSQSYHPVNRPGQTRRRDDLAEVVCTFSSGHVCLWGWVACLGVYLFEWVDVVVLMW
jgi:hypothetical protein